MYKFTYKIEWEANNRDGEEFEEDNSECLSESVLGD